MFGTIRNLWVEDSGASVVEYALMLCLVSAAVLIAMTSFGLTMSFIFQRDADRLAAIASP